MRPIYDNGIKPVEDATGYKMVRMDTIQHIERIDERMLVEIRRSRFVVADLTGHNRGVYFEAGYAMGLVLPVIWTCKEGGEKEAHFDTRQYNCIMWKDETDLREQLTNRILVLIGPYKKLMANP
jgi:nucleoside 2-deoxyribosyltransferase